MGPTSRMRITVIAQYFPPDIGGGSRRASNAVEGLRRRGHQIEVITGVPHYPDGIIPRKYSRRAFTIERYKGMRIIRVWLPSIPHKGLLRRVGIYCLFAISALLALPFARKPDVIWAANSNVFSSFPALILSFLKRAPIVRNVDDLWPEAAMEEEYFTEGLFARLGKFLAKAAYTLCKALTPISQTYKTEIKQRYKIPAAKIHVIEVGVDSNRFQPQEKRIPDDGKPLPITVMYSGILGTGYNFDLILKAAKVLASNSDIQFIIRGMGEREQIIRTRITIEGLSNVILSSDFLPLEQLVRILNSADILILPMMPLKAHEAGIPTKLFEYMACGKPIICCSKGEAARLVARARCGIIASPDNTEDVVKAILKLSLDKELREHLGRNGRSYITKHLSIEQIGRKMEAVFKAVAGF